MQWHPAGTKPIRNLANMLLAIGIIKVLPRSENLDRLGSTTHKLIQQPWMQPLLDVDVSGDRSKHYLCSAVAPLLACRPGLLRLAQGLTASQMAADSSRLFSFSVL